MRRKGEDIDAGNSEAHARLFLDELTGHGIQAPSLVAITHWHWDHVFGMSALTRIPTIATEDTKAGIEALKPFSWDDDSLDNRVEKGIEIEFCADAIKKEFPIKRNIRIVLPTITFSNELTLDLGGVTCVLTQVGGNHSPDGLVVYVKEEKTLFLADVLAPDLYASEWKFTPEETIKMLDRIEDYKAETYIVSHWKPITRNEYLQETDFLRRTAEAMLEFQGEETAVRRALEENNGSLSEEESRTLQYFINGWKKE
ncbi:MBL fold metallo-hydrolase [Alkalicoccus daliensis]|uniref:Glyoxylase, beta-lactamase superfamily II n=1 Tax=Alkalicoccus daliensis TaxID=745820 RepID=A0A1H0DS74_9BACI|nr:MBL fold metallo-hydrolase [Alkalicoccus daliensis]SDN72893.1 Glyoxylase, beta-lactamase superfamily II [Alkalicoccus daliensis]